MQQKPEHDTESRLTEIGAWRSLVARLLWEQEVGCSNHPAPTNNFNHLKRVLVESVLFFIKNRRWDRRYSLRSASWSFQSPPDSLSVFWFPFRSDLRISGWFSVNKLEIEYMEWYRHLYSGRQISQVMPTLLYSQLISYLPDSYRLYKLEALNQ